MCILNIRSGRSVQQRHGNRRWIPPDLEVKAQHYKTVSTIFHLNNKEAERELKVKHNNETLLWAQIPRRNVGQVAHISPIPRVTSQQVDITCRTPEAVYPLWLGCWSNNVANSHLSPDPFNSSVLHFSLVPQCSHPPYWPRHQRCLVNFDWMPASWWTTFLSLQASNLLRFLAVEPHRL